MKNLIVGFAIVVGLAACAPVPEAMEENGGALPDCVRRDCDCQDFTSQAQAQRVLDLTPDSDPHGLDVDGDRSACEGWGD